MISRKFRLFFLGLTGAAVLFGAGEYAARTVLLDPRTVNIRYGTTDDGAPRKYLTPLYSYRETFPTDRWDIRGYYAASNGIVEYHSDQFGARARKAEARPPAKTNILLFGDALAYGYGVRYEDTFADRLEKLLNEAGVPAAVLNFSEPNADADRAVVNYTRHDTDVPFEMVVYALQLNDLVRFAPNRLIRLPPLTGRLGRSVLCRWIYSKWDERFMRRERMIDVIEQVSPDVEYFSENLGALTDLDRALKRQKKKLVVAIVPVLMDLQTDTFRNAYEVVEARLKEKGIDTVDLTRDLRSYKDSDLWILPFDLHPNENAHALFAQALAGEIRRRLKEPQ